MKPVQFVDLQWNVNYENQDDFMQKFYSPIQIESEKNSLYKKNVYLILSDEFGIPHYWEIGKVINNLTGGKLSPKNNSKDMIQSIKRRMEGREFVLNDNGEIENLTVLLKKAIKEAGYYKT